jgi:putative Ca2+/H+ antiporter (TMEM165/GDT1 family)
MAGPRVNTLGDNRHGARSLLAWRDQRTDPAAAEQDGISRCSVARPGSTPVEAFLVSVTTVAIAEMGDRTQLLSLVLAAHYRKPWPILAGVLLATLANHALAGIVGVWFGKFLTPTFLDSVVGVSMIAMALWVLKPDALDGGDRANRRGAFVATLIAFFIAEIGDKTQIATIALAAGYSSLGAVVAGTTCGMLLANAPVVFLGKAFAARLPVRAIQYGASCLFAVLGAAFIIRVLM